VVANKKWMLFAVALAIGILLFFILSPGDAARIKKQFDFLAANIAKTPDESQLIGAANAKRIRSAFTETITLHAPAYDYTRDLAASELPALVLTARASYAELALTFYDFSIDFPQEGLADVRVTSRMRGLLLSGETIEDIQELHCRLRKIDDTWQFAAIEIVEVLEQ
jgi:hypothetical protein